MAKKIVVAKEVAIAEFVRMCEAYRLDLTLDEDAIEALMKPTVDAETGKELAPGLTREEAEQKLTTMFAEGHPNVLAAIMHGRLTISEDGKVRYSPWTHGAEAISFKRPTGACFMAMDAALGKPMTRNVLAATELTGCAPGAISKLDVDDFTVVVGATRLFLGLA